MISLIAAVDQNGGIGKENQLLCHLPEDLKHFKKKTLGQVVVMGRKTFDSIGKPLPQRTNIILTRGINFKTDSEQQCIIANSIDEVLEFAKILYQEVFIIGGGEIYQQFLPYAQKIYLTVIRGDFGADTFFPYFNRDEWNLKSSKIGKKDDKNLFDYYFHEYDRH